MKLSLAALCLVNFLLGSFCVFLVQCQQLPNADDQCKILLNNTNASFCQSHKSDLCSSIACRSSGSSTCVSMSFGAADGTLCGPNNMTCSNGECVQGTPNTDRDECLYGDDVILDQTIISDSLPAAQMNCPELIAFLVENKKSPFEYCSRPDFKKACCQTCKLYESAACQDLHPNECESLSSADCMSTSHLVEGLSVLVACARTCKACSQPELKCSSFLCMNGATCNESSSDANSLIGFKCICQPGYYGQFCELKNPCLPNPCKNNGACQRTGTIGFKCSCQTGFSGPNCNIRASSLALDASPLRQGLYPNLCYPNPCSGNAQCVLYTPTSYYCVCPPGYYGNLCQFSNGCFSNPCLNGGTCTPTTLWPNYYQCACPSGYYGLNCQFCWITTTTTTTPTTTISIAPNCVDTNPTYCYSLKISGYCNTIYGRLCPYSCDPRCCVDSQTSCQYWQNYCPQLIQSYPDLCRKTCGQC